jgi:hypothetical protein
MDDEPIPEHIIDLYSTAGLAGYRITRREESFLGLFRLTADTAWELGTANVGVFVGGTPALGKTIERLRRLESPGTARWVLVAATKKMAAVIARQWFQAESGSWVAPTRLTLPRYHMNLVLCTPESLRQVQPDERRPIAAIILIDMLCNVHLARGFENGDFHVANDRPQHVANFRNSLSRGGWAPPLIILTRKPAKSVWTDTVAQAFGLDALWFVDGRGLTCFAPGDGEVDEQYAH